MMKWCENYVISEFKNFYPLKNKKLLPTNGHASTIGQNLRDTLLTQHADVQSRKKIISVSSFPIPFFVKEVLLFAADYSYSLFHW